MVGKSLSKIFMHHPDLPPEIIENLKKGALTEVGRQTTSLVLSKGKQAITKVQEMLFSQNQKKEAEKLKKQAEYNAETLVKQLDRRVAFGLYMSAFILGIFGASGIWLNHPLTLGTASMALLYGEAFSPKQEGKEQAKNEQLDKK